MTTFQKVSICFVIGVLVILNIMAQRTIRRQKQILELKSETIQIQKESIAIQYRTIAGYEDFLSNCILAGPYIGPYGIINTNKP